MHILLLAQHYAPEEVSGAVLATELAEDLASRGHTVTFITCAPNYPEGRIFPGYSNALLAQEERSGVRVIRVWSYITPDKGFWPRIFNYGSFSAMALPGGLRARRPDVIFSYSPPLPLGVSAWLLSRRWRIPWVLRIEDLYPDAAVAAGVLRNPLAIRGFGRLERFLYRRANHISLISEGFRRNLLAKGVPPSKLSVTPVWADPDTVQPLPKANAWRSEHSLNDQFVVLYAGALGHTSAVEAVVDAAALLQTTPAIQFVIVGEGVKKEQLKQRAAAQHLTNVRFLPFQPRARFAEMLAAADVSLVTLNADSSNFSLPSKTFNIMASARPILAVTPAESEIAHLVATHNCGIVVAPGEPDALAATLRTLVQRSSDLHQLGVQGRTALETHYARSVCIDAFARLLDEQVKDVHHSTVGTRT